MKQLSSFTFFCSIHNPSIINSFTFHVNENSFFLTLSSSIFFSFPRERERKKERKKERERKRKREFPSHFLTYFFILWRAAFSLANCMFSTLVRRERERGGQRERERERQEKSEEKKTWEVKRRRAFFPHLEEKFLLTRKISPLSLSFH